MQTSTQHAENTSRSAERIILMMFGISALGGFGAIAAMIMIGMFS